MYFYTFHMCKMHAYVYILYIQSCNTRRWGVCVCVRVCPGSDDYSSFGFGSIYIYIYVCMCIYIYMDIYIYGYIHIYNLKRTRLIWPILLRNTEWPTKARKGKLALWLVVREAARWMTMSPGPRRRYRRTLRTCEKTPSSRVSAFNTSDT